jgi:hypothetical protein
MPNRDHFPMLYDPSYEDYTSALQRCMEMTAFLHDTFWQDREPAGHGSYPLTLTPEGTCGIGWFLRALQRTLEDLCEKWTCCGGPCVHHSERRQALDTVLTAYVTQEPEAMIPLQVLLENATRFRFTNWEHLTTMVIPPQQKGKRNGHDH